MNLFPAYPLVICRGTHELRPSLVFKESSLRASLVPNFRLRLLLHLAQAAVSPQGPEGPLSCHFRLLGQLIIACFTKEARISGLERSSDSIIGTTFRSLRRLHLAAVHSWSTELLPSPTPASRPILRQPLSVH